MRGFPGVEGGLRSKERRWLLWRERRLGWLDPESKR